ncbi:MAG: pyridoxamine 5'-phosphate oxidase family protein [Parvibaculum sp.]|nr:pyridoxamine 5'-phosphate oxidase family protein [Parvibaculum sp.]
MSDYDILAAHRLRQTAARGHYDRETVHAILDAGYVAHVAFMADAGPVALPMYYVRNGERLLVHASRKSRFMRKLCDGAPLCLTVTLLDGLVMARSAFHHSMNYRSVMVHGQGTVLPVGEKLAAFDLFVERVEAGRSATTRKANAQELKATDVLAIPLKQVVAKLRAGGPNDDAEDMDLPVWAGVIPLTLVTGAPEEAAS